MSLYGRTDSNANKTKVESTIAASSITPTIVFVDETEAGLNENRVRGIDGPGWWSYYTYTDTEGNTRHRSEKLVALADPDTNANETQSDDTIAADVASAVTITGQPASVTGASTPYTGTFTVTTSTTGTPGTLTYQWQRQTATGTTWSNLSNTGVYTGATTATLTLTAAAKATYDGYKFRVKITSAGGTEEVISNTATLTYA
jgi:uncharacterized Zn-binding protein involved in type VI secretion